MCTARAEPGEGSADESVDTEDCDASQAAGASTRSLISVPDSHCSSACLSTSVVGAAHPDNPRLAARRCHCSANPELGHRGVLTPTSQSDRSRSSMFSNRRSPKQRAQSARPGWSRYLAPFQLLPRFRQPKARGGCGFRETDHRYWQRPAVQHRLQRASNTREDL